MIFLLRSVWQVSTASSIFLDILGSSEFLLKPKICCQIKLSMWEWPIILSTTVSSKLCAQAFNGKLIQLRSLIKIKLLNSIIVIMLYLLVELLFFSFFLCLSVSFFIAFFSLFFSLSLSFFLSFSISFSLFFYLFLSLFFSLFLSFFFSLFLSLSLSLSLSFSLSLFVNFSVFWKMSHHLSV